jgi:hypothetical protein
LADAVPEPAAPSTAITSSIGPQRAAVGLTPGWLATQASSPGYAGQHTERAAERALPACKVRAGNMTEESERLPRPLPLHTRRSRGRLERHRVPGHPRYCRSCRYPPPTLGFLPRCPVCGTGIAGQAGHAPRPDAPAASAIRDAAHPRSRAGALTPSPSRWLRQPDPQLARPPAGHRAWPSRQANSAGSRRHDARADHIVQTGDQIDQSLQRHSVRFGIADRAEFPGFVRSWCRWRGCLSVC